MSSIVIKPYNVINKENLPEIFVGKVPAEGDPLEIENELYFVCDGDTSQGSGNPSVGVIPLVVRNPREVTNISDYINCLSIAHRKVRFMNETGECDLSNCNEMVIS